MLNKRSVGIIEPPLLVSPEHRRGSRGAKTTQIINGLHSCMHTHAYTHLDTRTCCGVLCGSWLMCRLLVKCVTCLQVAQRARVCTHDRTLVAFNSSSWQCQKDEDGAQVTWGGKKGKNKKQKQDSSLLRSRDCSESWMSSWQSSVSKEKMPHEKKKKEKKNLSVLERKVAR